MNAGYEDFSERLAAGLFEEAQLADYIQTNIATLGHRMYMANHNITPSMILNGQIVCAGPDMHTDMEGLQDMIDAWNATVGENFIFAIYHRAKDPAEDLDEKKQVALNAISDLVGELMYDGRREDEDLSVDDMEQLVESGTLTIEEMVEAFERALRA